MSVCFGSLFFGGVGGWGEEREFSTIEQSLTERGLKSGQQKKGQKDVRPGFLAGNSVFWRETTSVNIVSTASYKTNHNAAIRKQMWFTFLTATD